MIENIVENLQQHGFHWTHLISMPLLAAGFIGAGWIAYSLHKNPPTGGEVEEANLTEIHYETLRELRESSILNEDKDKFYIDKKSLTSYDLERLAEE